MIECRHVSLSYHQSVVLRDVSFTAAPGEITALLGCNGCGKSSLLRGIAGQLPTGGEITLCNLPLRTMREKQRAACLSMLPQVLPAPPITVRELVAMGRAPYTGWTQRLHDTDRQAIDEAMQITDCTDLADRSVRTLSGGERQRAFFALIYAQNTPAILLDEPTTYLDARTQQQFFTFLERLKENGKTVLLVMHDLPAALERADRFVLLHDGLSTVYANAEACLSDGLLQSSFGIALDRVTVEGRTRYLIH